MADGDPTVPVPNATKDHLYDVARRLGVRGRSTMSKCELAAAVEAVRSRKAAEGRDDPRSARR